MTRIIKKNVLGFEVTVNHFEAMQALKSAEQLRSVEPGSVNIKSLLSLEVMEKLSTIYKGQNEVKFLW